MKQLKKDIISERRQAEKDVDEERRKKRLQKEEEDMVALGQSINSRVKSQRRKKKPKFYDDSDSEEEEEEEEEEDEETKKKRKKAEREADHHVKDAPDGTPKIHRGLMIYLYALQAAMMLAGYGNVCRWNKLKNWRTDSFTKMDYRRCADLLRCGNWCQSVAYDTWDVDKHNVPLPFPWEKLRSVAPLLLKPTAEMRLGFLGMVEWIRRKRIIYLDYMLCRRFSSEELLIAAEEVHVTECLEHLRFNPTVQSDLCKGRCQSRYQVIEGQGNNLRYFRQLHDFASNTKKEVESLPTGVKVVSKPIVLKVGLWNNSSLENMIGHMRYLCNQGSLTGANLAFVWRRFLSLRLSSNHLTSARKRRDLEHLRKSIEQFAHLKSPAETHAVWVVVKDLVAEVVAEVRETIDEMEM